MAEDSESEFELTLASEDSFDDSLPEIGLSTLQPATTSCIPPPAQLQATASPSRAFPLPHSGLLPSSLSPLKQDELREHRKQAQRAAVNESKVKQLSVDIQVKTEQTKAV